MIKKKKSCGNYTLTYLITYILQCRSFCNALGEPVYSLLTTLFSLHNLGFSLNRMESIKLEQHFRLVTHTFLFMWDRHKTLPGMQINATVVQASHIEPTILWPLIRQKMNILLDTTQLAN